MTDEIKQATKVYLMGIVWLIFHEDEKGIDQDKVKKMKERIEKTEDFLVTNGYTQEQITLLLDRAEQFAHMKAKDLNPEQMVMYCQLLFGAKIQFDQKWGEKYRHGMHDMRTYPPKSPIDKS